MLQLSNEKNDTFCVLPFIHAVYNPFNAETENCNILPCCRYDLNFHTETEQHISPIKNSEIFKNLQEELSSGVKSKPCWRCWKDEKIGIKSYRQGMNESFSDLILTGEYENKNLRFLEITPSNLCNLACRSCNSSFSSKWAPIDNFIASDKKQNKISFPDWKKIDVSNLIELKLMGGEPMLLQENIDFLEYLNKENKLKNITLTVITNLMRPLTKKWKELFVNCKQVHLYVSIDAIGELNDYIREDSSWDAVEKNLYEFLDFSKKTNVNIAVNTVITILNVNVSAEIEKYFKERGISAYQDVTSFPPHLDCKQLPEKIKNKLIEKGVSSTVEKNIFTLSEREDIIEEFYEQTFRLDRYHKKNFKEYNPDMYEVLQCN